MISAYSHFFRGEVPHFRLGMGLKIALFSPSNWVTNKEIIIHVLIINIIFVVLKLGIWLSLTHVTVKVYDILIDRYI